jgi:hypothetical protein
LKEDVAVVQGRLDYSLLREEVGVILISMQWVGWCMGVGVVVDVRVRA